MENVGQTIIKMIVKITNVELLGNEIMEETEDEAVVSITVVQACEDLRQYLFNKLSVIHTQLPDLSC